MDAISMDLEYQSAAAHPEACTSSSDTVLSNITQGSSNTCSAMAFAQAYTIKFAIQKPPPAQVPQLSPLFAYYYQRVQECRLDGLCPCTTCKAPCQDACEPPCVDCGSTLRAAASVYLRGVCKASFWPLSSPLNAPPDFAALQDAENYSVSELSCVTVGPGMSNEVLSQLRAGNPVIIFLNLDSNMQNWMQALVDWPNVDLEADAVQLPALGPKMPYVGHVVVAVGYVAASRNFIMRNSFGFGWGVGGRFTIALDDMNSTVCQSAVSLISVK